MRGQSETGVRGQVGKGVGKVKRSAGANTERHGRAKRDRCVVE